MRLYHEFLGGSRGVALLILRLVAGTAFVLHGYPKIQHAMSWMGPKAPVPGWLQLLAAISEFGGGIAWVLGALTPLFSFGLVCTMGFATFAVHVAMKHPFIGEPMPDNPMYHGPGIEQAAVYLAIAILFLIVGPGQFSVDALLFGRKTAKPEPAREIAA